MIKTIYDYYWKIGFKTRLYDWMSPRAYLDSVRVSVGFLHLQPGDRVLDVGCGTGLALDYMKNDLGGEGAHYVGLDILPAGLDAARGKVNRYNVMGKAALVQADLLQPLPFKPESFSKILSHYCIYTLRDRKDRVAVWKSLIELTKPNGVLVTTNPSTNYNPKEITRESVVQIRCEKGFWVAQVLGFVYFLAEKLGLRHIKCQLDEKTWHAYTIEDFKDELTEAGWVIDHSQSVYGGSGLMIVAKKRC